MKNKTHKTIFTTNGVLVIIALCVYLGLMCIDREKETESKSTPPMTTQLNIPSSVNTYLEESYKRIVVLKFYANWCPPCRQLTPIFEAIKKEYGDQHVYVSINIEEHEALANYFNIKSIPHIIILKDGLVVDQIRGLVSKNEIISKIVQHTNQVKKKVELAEENLVIIGSGPAGLTAGVYAARAGLNPIIIEGPKPGGQLMDTAVVENWPGYEAITGSDLIETLKNHAKQSGARLVDGEAVSVDFTKKPFSITTNDKQTIKTKAVIIATGATPKRLYCPGEDTFWGNGISTCALCDGALYKNKEIVIVGGGYTAVEDALFLKRFTEKITIIHLHDELKVSNSLKEKISKETGIKIIYNSTVTKFIGLENQLQEVEIINTKTKEKTNLKADGVFLAIGLSPNAELFCDQLECEQSGHIKAYNHTKTSIPGVFVAGDVQDVQYRQAIVSAGFGSMAAIEAEKYLQSITS